jgi:hypothetical protein
MDDVKQLEELLEAHEREHGFAERLKIRNIMLGLLIPALSNFESEPQEMQDTITRIADHVAAKNYRTTIYDFLRFQENPALKSSDLNSDISGKFNNEKIHMQAFAEGFLSGFDMDLSSWGKFVLGRMKQMRVNESRHLPESGNKIIPFRGRE